MTAHDSEVAEGAGFLTRHKFVSETALLLYAVHRTEDSRFEPRVRSLAARLSSAARNDEVMTWIRLRPASAGELTVAHYCLTRIGLLDQVFDNEVRASVEASSIGPPERASWKDLESDWHARLGAGSTQPRHEHALLRAAISNTPDALFGSRLDSYAFTHGLLYATDFGHSQPLLPTSHDEILSTATAALSRWLDDDDFDLVAEVLMAWPHLRAAWPASPAFAFRVMANMSDEAGVLPSLNFRSAKYNEMAPDAASRYFYEENYHTEYVFGILIASMLRRGAAPPLCPHVKKYLDAEKTFHRLHALLAPRDPIPHWQRMLADCSGSEQESLVELLADITVLRAVQKADYGLLREVLGIVLNSSVPPSQVVIQGIELLSRLARAATGPARTFTSTWSTN